VWGSTIPLDKGDAGQSMFEGEFELLHNSAMKRRLLRLSAPFSPVRQLRIFNFPLHFGSARRKIGAFVATLFRPNPFSENPLLRGFYFSASPAAKSSPNAPQTVADTFFTHRFFRDVLLRDKDIVRAFQARKQGAPLLGWASILLGAGLLIILLSLSGVSLYNNKKMLEDARARGEALIAITQTSAYKDPSKADEKATRAEIDTTESLRELIVKLDDYERNGAPWFMRFGLYSGNRVYKQHLLKVYMDVIEHRYKTATIAKVQSDLKKFSTSNPVVNSTQLTDAEEALLGKNYDLLKAYLMLAGPYKDKADSAHIASALKDYWTTEGKIPAELKTKAALQLEFWAKQVDRDDQDYSFPRILIDEKLVADTRAKLQAFPAVFRYYKRKVTEISKAVDEKVGPTTVDAILARNGSDARFLDGAYQVRSIFTRSGNELMKKALKEADEKLSEDDWVMGEVGKSKIAQTTDSKKLEDRYYRDYADEWRAFAKGITVKPYKTKEDAAAALQVFSLENSPMKVLMIEISRNTNLSAPPEVIGWWDWIKSFVVSQENPNAGGTPPEKEFQPLFEFVGKKGQKDRAPVDNYGASLQNVYKNLNGISAEKLKQVSDDLANEKDDSLKLLSNERAIIGMIQSFTTSSTQELATVLQEPLGNLKSLLGQGAQDQLKKSWSEQIMPAAKEIEKGFPFEDGQSESDLTKLTAFLNPTDGKLSKFYDDRLKKYFEESNGQLKLKDTAEVKFSDEFVAYLNNAFALRKALYGTGNTPKFEYAFALKVGKDSLVEVTIDGQKVTSEGTASINGSFPAAQSAETGVIVSSGASGATTTTAPPASNSATPPTSDSSSLKFPGTWGLFRFVDAGKPQKQAGGEYTLSYSVGGKSVSATVRPSGGDLFDKSIFRQVKAPQNMLK
ncbi:MAG TPA: ImcF-related family protein, partial [Pyrinomonadaceae bacterium]|nr:ImcF-related family protein [Pyrinomonadaceae bacterium]